MFVRSVVNLSRFPSGLASLVGAGVLEPMLHAVTLHPTARDITEGALAMLKLAGRSQPGLLQGALCCSWSLPVDRC